MDQTLQILNLNNVPKKRLAACMRAFVLGLILPLAVAYAPHVFMCPTSTGFTRPVRKVVGSFSAGLRRV